MEQLRSIRTRIYSCLCRLKWEVGQTTAEYALVLLAAAVIAVLLIQWANDNEALKDFFTSVIDKVSEGTDAAEF